MVAAAGRTAAGGSSGAHLPNIMPGIVTFSLLGIGVVIILEGALDFLATESRHPGELGLHDRERQQC